MVEWQKASVLELVGLAKKKKKECIENRKTERPIFLRVGGKNKAITQKCTAHESTGHPLEEVLKAQAGK